MQIILIGFALAFSAALFWMSFVFVTQDHSRSWKEMILWIILAALISAPATYFGELSNDQLYATLGKLGTYILRYLVLYLVLSFRYHLEKIGQKLKILAIHLVGTSILGFAIGLTYS